MAAVVDKEPEIVDESDGDDDVPEDAYDVLESALCGEYGSDGHNVNMSQSVKNDVKNAQRAAHKANEYRPVPRHARDHGTSARPENTTHFVQAAATKCFRETRGLPLDGQGGERLLRFVWRWTTGHRGDKRHSHKFTARR